jgi:hypothetical protein
VVTIDVDSGATRRGVGNEASSDRAPQAGVAAVDTTMDVRHARRFVGDGSDMGRMSARFMQLRHLSAGALQPWRRTGASDAKVGIGRRGERQLVEGLMHAPRRLRHGERSGPLEWGGEAARS